MRLPFLLTLLLLTSSCTLFDDHAVRAERSIDAAVLAFQGERQRFPRNLAELQAFADGRMSLDLEPFATVHFEHPAPEVLQVDLTSASEEDLSVSLRYEVTY